jgi:hypothetical protein
MANAAQLFPTIHQLCQSLIEPDEYSGAIDWPKHQVQVDGHVVVERDLERKRRKRQKPMQCQERSRAGSDNHTTKKLLATSYQLGVGLATAAISRPANRVAGN